MAILPDKLSSPAALRNRGPILEVLSTILPARGTIVEIASGSGEHAVHFARHFPQLTWQPSDPADEARASISAWTIEAGLRNVRPPVRLDASADSWPVAQADAIVCINMLHISPWQATEGLLRGSGRLLPPGAPLFIYGPFRQASTPTAPSNEAFDADLRRRDPRWGLREVEAVASCAEEYGLSLDRIVEMPANNLSLVFRRRRDPD